MSATSDFISMASIVYSGQLISHHFTEITGIYNSNQNQLLEYINTAWIPFRLQIDVFSNKTSKKLFEKSFLKGKSSQENGLKMYICQNYVCSLPLKDVESVIGYLKSLYPSIPFNS